MNEPIKNIVFAGEWLWLGNLGHTFTIIAFIAAIASAYFYFQHESSKDNSMLQWAKRCFQLHAISIVGVFVVVFDHFLSSI